VFLNAPKGSGQADTNAETPCLVLAVDVVRDPTGPSAAPSVTTARQAELTVRTTAMGGGYPNVRSDQRVQTADNHEVRVKAIGERSPSAPREKTDSAIVVSATPHIRDDGSVLVEVAADVNDLSQSADAKSVPLATHRTFRNNAIIPCGGTALVIGLKYRPAGQTEGATREMAIYVTVEEPASARS
jgi:hypothetical protein